MQLLSFATLEVMEYFRILFLITTHPDSAISLEFPSEISFSVNTRIKLIVSSVDFSSFKMIEDDVFRISRRALFSSWRDYLSNIFIVFLIFFSTSSTNFWSMRISCSSLLISLIMFSIWALFSFSNNLLLFRDFLKRVGFLSRISLQWSSQSLFFNRIIPFF